MHPSSLSVGATSAESSFLTVSSMPDFAFTRAKTVTCLPSIGVLLTLRYFLEYGNRVEWRSGRPRQPQRRKNHHEFPAPLFGADLHQLLELQAVRAEHAHRRDLERVNRIWNAVYQARHDLPVTVWQKDCYLAFVEQFESIRMKPGPPLAGVAYVPRAQFEAAPVVTGAEDHDIAFTKPHAHGALGSFDILPCHGLAGL